MCVLLRTVISSKSEPIGVWLVSATHQQPGDPGSSGHPGISLEQQGAQNNMAHPSDSLKVEPHDYGMPGGKILPMCIHGIYSSVLLV